MKPIRLALAGLYLLSSAGCSQLHQLPTRDAMQARDLKDATVRTRTGEVYYFERAVVEADSLSGLAQESRTVYLEGGGSEEVTEARRVRVALADVEQLSVRRRDWKRAGLWALATVGVAGLLAIVSSQNSGTTPGGGSGGGKPPPGE